MNLLLLRRAMDRGCQSLTSRLQRQASPNIVIALVGNKLDLVSSSDASGSSQPAAKPKSTTAEAVEGEDKADESDAASASSADADATPAKPSTSATTEETEETEDAEDTENADAGSDNPRQISTAEAATYAAESKLLFTEASAKTGQGIQEIFETIAKAIPVDTPAAPGAAGAGAAGQGREGQQGRARAREGVDLGETQAKKGGCC